MDFIAKHIMPDNPLEDYLLVISIRHSYLLDLAHLAQSLVVDTA